MDPLKNARSVGCPETNFFGRDGWSQRNAGWNPGPSRCGIEGVKRWTGVLPRTKKEDEMYESTNRNHWT